MTTSLNLTVLALVLERLPPMEILPLRLICKDWDKLIGEGTLLQNLLFRVSNNQDDSINSFRSLSPSFKLKNFRFELLDMEGIFGDLKVFRHFSLNHCPGITYIFMNTCQLPSGRFFELLAFCKSLKFLGIRHCPSVFQTDLSIRHWGFCFDSVRRCLAGLTSLQVTDEMIPEVDLWALTCEMKSLRMVHLGCDDSIQAPLPIESILNLLKNNCETLAGLTLFGKLYNRITHEDLLKLANFPQLEALTSLKLVRGYFHSSLHTYVLEELLKKCPKLRELFLSKATLESTTLASLGTSLVDLQLKECFFHPDTLKNAKLSQLNHLKIVQSENTSIDPILSLLKCKHPMLETLELDILCGGKDCVKAMVPSRYPKLKGFLLRGCLGIWASELRGFFTRFRNLQSLALKNCEDLEDRHFCATATKGCLEKSLGNLTNLEVLDLSGTKIGNQTVKECICRMKKLAHLLIDKTDVDKAGLELILEAVKDQLAFLSTVSVNDSKFEISKEALAELQKIAPQVKISCTPSK